MLGTAIKDSCSSSPSLAMLTHLSPPWMSASLFPNPTFMMLPARLVAGWRIEHPSRLCTFNVRLYLGAVSEADCIPGLNHDAPHCSDRTQLVDDFQCIRSVDRLQEIDSSGRCGDRRFSWSVVVAVAWARVVQADSITRGRPANLDITDNQGPGPFYSPARCSLHIMDNIVCLMDANEVDIFLWGIARQGKPVVRPGNKGKRPLVVDTDL